MCTYLFCLEIKTAVYTCLRTFNKKLNKNKKETLVD